FVLVGFRVVVRNAEKIECVVGGSHIVWRREVMFPRPPGSLPLYLFPSGTVIKRFAAHGRLQNLPQFIFEHSYRFELGHRFQNLMINPETLLSLDQRDSGFSEGRSFYSSS